MVLTQHSKAKAAGLRVSPDLPKEIQREKILLEKVQKLAHQDGTVFKIEGKQMVLQREGIHS